MKLRPRVRDSVIVLKLDFQLKIGNFQIKYKIYIKTFISILKEFFLNIVSLNFQVVEYLFPISSNFFLFNFEFILIFSFVFSLKLSQEIVFICLFKYFIMSNLGNDIKIQFHAIGLSSVENVIYRYIMLIPFVFLLLTK